MGLIVYGNINKLRDKVSATAVKSMLSYPHTVPEYTMCILRNNKKVL